MRREDGFTLIELLLASVIMAVLGTLTLGALSATFQTEKTIDERTILQEIATAALGKMREDLSQAFLVEAVRQITYFTGQTFADDPKLSFTTFAHLRSGPDAHESDQTIVTYDTQPDPADSRLRVLRRSENRYLTSDKNDIGDSVVLATNVASFRLEYHDGQNYQNMWDSKSIDLRNKLPKSVRVTLKLRDQRDREEIYEGLMEIPMADTLGVDRTGAAAGTTGGATTSPTQQTSPATSRGRGNQK